MDRRRCSPSLPSSPAGPWPWFVGAARFARNRPPHARHSLRGTWAGTFPQARPSYPIGYRLSGKADYLVRVKDGIAPVELKVQSVSFRRPPLGDGHLFQGRPYSLLVEVRFWPCLSPYGTGSDTRIAPSGWSTLRRYVQACLRFFDEIRTAKRWWGCYINHNQLASAGLRVRSHMRRESDLSALLIKQRLDFRTPRSVCSVSQASSGRP